MILDLVYDKAKAKTSRYDPSKEVKERTQQVLADFQVANQIRTKSYREFNNMSLLERQSLDQKAFNSYQPPQSTNPDDAWKSNAIRPITRNKIISIAAHVTGSLLFPQIFAQNDSDEEDKDAATVMRDLMEWSADQSDYARTFVYAVVAALVNPAVIIHTEFANVFREIKEITKDGKWDKKRILDELLSGFQDAIVPLDELYILDIYQHNIQKQPALIWRRAIDFNTAVLKYGDNKLFKEHVRPGLQVFFGEDGETFYEQYDESLQERLVEEIIYYNRAYDLQLTFVNGILLTDPDQPNPRKDKQYPFAKSGYELIDEGKFFYYKSLSFKMTNDQQVIDKLYQMVIDGTFMQLMPPTAVYGSEAISSAVIVPGMVTTFQDVNTKMESFAPQSNLQAGYNTLEKVEDSLAESSSDVLQSGQSNAGSQTAFEVSRLEQNAKTQLGLFAKMVGFLVKDYGELRVSDICQFLTVGEVSELSDGLKFRTFALPDKEVEGRRKTRKIDFTLDMPDEGYTDDEKLDKSFDLLDEEGGMDSDTEIYRVNPRLFRKMKYKVLISPDMITPPSENLKKALNLELYDRAIQNPLADPEAVTREFLFGSYEASKGDPDRFIKKQDAMAGMMGMEAGAGAQGGMAPSLASPGKSGSTSELLSKVV